MNNIFKLFYKSKGGVATWGNPQYHYPVASIEADNFEELGKKATKIIDDMGIGMGEFSVDLFNVGKEYENANGTGRTSQQKYSTNVS